MPFSPAHLRADAVAGLTTSAVVIPRAMAMAAIAGLPLEIGLYTAMVPAVIYAALGTSRPLIVTATSTTAILVATAVASLPAAAGDPATAIAASAMLALIAGAALVAASILRLGFVADFISLPVLTGFKAGTAVVIIVDQLPRLLGVQFPKGGFLQNVASVVQHVPEASIGTVVVAVTLLVLLLALERFLPAVPGALVAVALAIAVSAMLPLGQYGVALVGQIRGGLPSLGWPDASLALALWPAGAGIALMSFVETIAAGRAFVAPGEPPPDSNRELAALGLANAAGSVFNCMPASAGTSQTALNRSAGARTQVAAVVAAAAVAATLVVLAPLVALLPHAALAAVIVVSTLALLRPSEFRAIRRVRKRDFWWAIAAVAGVVLLGTLNGILVAVALSVLVLLYEANRPPVYALGRRRGTDVFERLAPGATNDELETLPGMVIMRVEGRVYFANMARIGDRIWPVVRLAKPAVLALDMSAVLDLEYTALVSLTAAEKDLRDAGTSLWLAALNPGVRDVIDRAPLGAILGPDRIFPSLSQAVDAYSRRTIA
jgi:SulP family sulfate permease